jgi:hypothetical protein
MLNINNIVGDPKRADCQLIARGALFLVQDMIDAAIVAAGELL